MAVQLVKETPPSCQIPVDKNMWCAPHDAPPQLTDSAWDHHCVNWAFHAHTNNRKSKAFCHSPKSRPKKNRLQRRKLGRVVWLIVACGRCSMGILRKAMRNKSSRHTNLCKHLNQNRNTKTHSPNERFCSVCRGLHDELWQRGLYEVKKRMFGKRLETF